MVGDVRSRIATLPDSSVHCCVTSPPYFGLRSYLPDEHPDKCLEIGRESNPDEYVDAMVHVFREVMRVLRDDGTLWLNLGDSYASIGGKSVQGATSARYGRKNAVAQTQATANRYRPCGDYIKPKDLIGIPWMVAFALRADGWFLRGDNIWSKRNCTPESVGDRMTRSHEYVFQFSKSPQYFFDWKAVEEEGDIPAGTRGAKASNARADAARVNSRPPEYWEYTGRRRKRSVWHEITMPYPEAHFATMTPAIAETCIKAGTSEAGVCSVCGTPTVRVLGDRSDAPGRASGNKHRITGDQAGYQPGNHRGYSFPWKPTTQDTVRWHHACHCEPAPCRPATVLDPFGGAGTTAVVASRLGRDSILIELNASYAEMAERRIRSDAGMFCNVEMETGNG